VNPTGPQGDETSPPGAKVRRVVVRRPPDDDFDDQRGRPLADRDEVWGEGDTSNDERLKRDVPPHHGG
jgi:hypothetical protein